jgi:hypothetical protein
MGGTDRTLFLAMDELVRRHARGPLGGDDRSLASCELRAFSQNGEDGVIAEIFARIGTTDRRFVEFGVEAGIEANCVMLADVLGWSGVFIEGDPGHHRRLAGKYAANRRIRTRQAFMTPENVETVFAEEEVPPEFDLLSIDVDSTDYWIWDAIHHYSPRVVVIEYNAALGLERRLVQPRDWGHWSGTDASGGSLPALEALGLAKGYRLVHTEMAGCNAFFVREELTADRFCAPDDVARVGDPNYFLQGLRHPPDPRVERFVDPMPELDSPVGPPRLRSSTGADGTRRVRGAEAETG